VRKSVEGAPVGEQGFMAHSLQVRSFPKEQSQTLQFLALALKWLKIMPA
jgi:hypothetical protein